MVHILHLSTLCALLLVAGCNNGISDKNLTYIMPGDAVVLLQENQSDLLGTKASTIVVDPRPSWSYRKSHIVESMNIPFGRLSFQAWRLDDANTIIVSGETYNDSVAIAMSKALIKLGFTDVKTLRGGVMGWGDAGEPVETLE